MAKLSEQQWRKARETWEADSRDGYAWLIRELGLDVSGPAVRKRALKEEWIKGGSEAKPARKPKTQKPKAKTGNRKPRQKPETPVEELEELPPELADKAVPLEDAETIPWDEAGEEEGGASHNFTLTRVCTQSLEEDFGDSPLHEIYETDASGRTKYRRQYARLAYKHALLGATPAHVASLLEVTERTVYDWMEAHPEFRAAMEQGRVDADANVARSLYKKATGYTHQAVKVFQYQGAPVVVPYTEIVPPDTEAAKFWLKNRQPELWKEKVEIEEKPSIALVDREARRERIEAALAKAAQVEREMRNRADRLGLIIDGSTGEVDDG
ncbi:hypothetical protein [Halomonas salipaludis]|uniref:Helix-turn-helix domain-containing protein n=1 Tax=Halomonas salipaludis TaxID=2032625 RepID=A0A2A2F343_9GAMM|nr:hypothetical protein [Halomonas salipaludis]PAU79210.1 hypothetical protein CK498_02245 [Halomonas salipaludis]